MNRAGHWIGLAGIADEPCCTSTLASWEARIRVETQQACPNCQVANRATARFCRECGTHFAPSCASCGNPLRERARFCDSCGSPAPAGTDGAPGTPGAAPAARAGTGVRPSGSGPPVPQGRAPASDLGADDTLASGRYRIDRFIGEGASKRVYLAHDNELRRRVAVAVIKSEGMGESGIARVQREIQAMGRLSDHPHIVPILAAGDEGGVPYIVSQYMDGGDLASETREAGGLPVDRCIELGREIASGLAHAHANGILHRDLKPENVWMTSTGGAKLGDFGLALIADRTRITLDGAMMGTAAYMAPEVATDGAAAADERSDLYSLGALLYELLAGAQPFTGTIQSVIMQHITTPPEALSRLNPAVPKALESLVHRLMAKSPRERPNSAEEVAQQLEAMAVARGGATGAVARGGATETAAGGEPAAAAGGEAAASGTEHTADSATGAGSRDGRTPAELTGEGFVGREAELATIRDAVDRAISGRGSLLLVTGEPGIGKTRLAEEAVTYAELRGAEVLVGRCFETEGAPSFWPWTQVIRQLLEHFAADAASLLGHGAEFIAQVVPEVREVAPDAGSLPTLDPEEVRFRVFDAIASTLRRAGEVRPQLIVLDDLHSADKPSLLLLEFLARQLDGVRLLVIGTYRDVEVTKGHPLADLLAGVARERNFQRVQLGGLSETDVAAFVEKSAGVSPTDSLVTTVYRETEGNPFFVHEVVQLLVEDGRIGPGAPAGASGEWSLVVPEGVRDTVHQRLDRISPESARALTVASVIGREFTLGAVEQASDVKGDDLIAAFEEVCAAGLVGEVEDGLGTYRFTHALIREVLYDEISPARRPALHRAVGEALETQYLRSTDKHLAELAFHFAQAAPAAGTEKAVGYGRRAAEQMIGMVAFESAAAQYRSVLGLLEKDPGASDADRCDILIALAGAEWKSGEAAGRRSAALAAAKIAHELGDAERLATASLTLAGFTGDFGSLNTDFVSYAAEALDLLGPEDSVLRARLMGRLIVERWWADPAGASGAAETARILEADETLAMAERVGDKVALGHALYCKINALVDPVYRSERLALADGMIELGESAGELEIIQIGQICRICSLIELADLPALDREMAAFEKRAEQLRDPFMMSATALLAAMRELLRGNIAAAEVLAGEALRLGQVAGLANSMLAYGAQMAFIRMEQGRAGELVPVLETYVAQFPEALAWRAALPYTCFEAGDRERAREEYEFFVSTGFANLPKDFNWMTGMCYLAHAAQLLEDREGAARIHEALAPFEDFVGAIALGAVCAGPVARELALCARAAGLYDEAVAHGEVALEKCRTLQARVLEAHVKEELAQTLVARSAEGDRERARELVEQATTAFREFGLDHWISPAEDVVAEAGT